VGIVLAGLAETEIAVDCVAHIAGVGVFLAVVFPPANRAERHRGGRLKCPEAAAWAAEESRFGPHTVVDEKTAGNVYAKKAWAESRIRA